MGLINALKRILGFNGPNEIAKAYRALNGGEEPIHARLGKPRLKDYGDFTSDYKAVIPLRSSKYEDPAPLVIDVEDELDDFLSHFDLTVESIGELRGEVVTVAMQNGSPVPLLNSDPYGVE